MDIGLRQGDRSDKTQIRVDVEVEFKAVTSGSDMRRSTHLETGFEADSFQLGLGLGLGLGLETGFEADSFPTD